MEEYKKTIYHLWAAKKVAMFPQPKGAFLQQRMQAAKDSIIAPFFGADKNAKIVDLGCGWGTFLKACFESGYHNISGVDSVDLGVDNVAIGDIVEYLAALPDFSCDIITAFDVMEHFEKSEILGVLQLIYSKLKKSGKFIMQVPNAGSPSGLYVYFSDITHTMPFTDALIEELFLLAGFEDTVISGVVGQTNMLKNIFRAVRNAFVRNKFIHYTNLLAVGKK